MPVLLLHDLARETKTLTYSSARDGIILLARVHARAHTYTQIQTHAMWEQSIVFAFH